MKKIIALLLVVALTAALSVSLTMAYLQDQEETVNVMTLGNVEIDQHEYQRADKTKHTGLLTDGGLVAFEQNQPLYPAVPKDGSAYTAEQSSLLYWGPYVTAESDGTMGNGGAGNGLWNDSMLSNVMDKMIFVENTGKSDCYYRTIIAFECPEGITIGEPANGAEIMINSNGNNRFATRFVDYVTIDDARFAVWEYVYNNILPVGKISRPSLLQVVMTHHATNEDMKLLGDTYEILAVSQAVQVEGFDSAEEALNTAFGEIDVNNHPWNSATIDDVNDSDKLEDTLKNPDASTIVVNLSGDVTYDIAAWTEDAMGGEKTKQIVINGNGHTITFNKTGSDWTNIVTNGAKLVINNATITDSGYDSDSGTWNAHDITFNCEVELNDVISLSAIAFEHDAVLNNVTITDDSTGDAYLVWITAAGQTVTMNNCVIDATTSDGNDRGIKIDNQYVGEEMPVTLNVKNTKFVTEKKAAIIVKSTVGAVINLSNVDITNVTADSTNAVWVDKDAAAYADLVVVSGGTKVTEN